MCVASQRGFSFGAMIGGVRVLVVEDDVRMAAAIRRGLRFEGLVVDLAGGGEEALRLVRAIAYDVLVLDVMMPGWTDSRRVGAYVRVACGCPC